MADNKLKVLLVVGDANSVFVENYAKWLKIKTDCQIDVFQFRDYFNKDVESEYIDTLDKSATRIPRYVANRLLYNYIIDYQRFLLKKFLKDKQYDVIHCHWLISESVYCTKLLRKHTRCLIGTLWGGEYTKQMIKGSNNAYLVYLKKFVQALDYFINPKSDHKIIEKKYHCNALKLRDGNLGAVGLDAMEPLLHVNRSGSKCFFGLPVDKVIVQIGYSGKELHRQYDIVEELVKHPELQNKVHILNPMTRDSNDAYIKRVDEALNTSGFTYTTIKGPSLTDAEICQLRYATDVVLQFSEFDGFSRSIVEALCAKSVVIYGSWLNYENSLAQYNYYAISAATIEDGIKKLSYVVDHMDEYKDACEKNSLSGFKANQWKYCIDDWIRVYEEGTQKKWYKEGYGKTIA